MATKNVIADLVKALWDQLKFSFGGTSTTRLRSLVIKFEEYTKDPKHTMSEHLRVMSNMIGKLRDAGYALTDKQQVRAVIRLDPIGQDRMTRLVREGLLGPLAKVNLQPCEACLAGKACMKPFGKAVRVTQPLELVHSDIYGPMSVKARHGASYFLTLIDDYTRYGYVYLISHCYEALEYFKRFVAEVENQKEKSLKTLRNDQGREYLLDHFKKFCEEKGIRRKLPIPNTPQQNGVAERRNRTLLDMVRSMMAQANLPISFWEDALLTAAYSLYHVPSQSVKSIPYELWNGQKPNLDNLRPWGSAGFVHSTSHKYEKLGPRVKKSIFLRYSENSKGYVMYGEHPNGGRTEIESRDIDFIESDFPSIGDASKNLDLYELEEVEATLPSPSKGGELVSHPVIAKDSISDPQPSGSIPDSGSTPPGPLGQQDSQLRRAGNDMSSIVATKQWMSSNFEIKNMGEANYVLEVKIIRDRPKRLLGYNDDDWGIDRDEGRSTSGGAISWYSKKKSCIALSTMELEYVAWTAAVQEVV
ncbi:hypothetical protein RJ640_014189 [Escallonia rubra]|uniref:Integrase catalytic domain-containing protein n=1 Tax=Escallonia rubra TaxID=112253 RepID=A0AA88QZL9_9ASTE|nr:hypothetical protein RJ640_014189 [Escallonia rubra]